MYEELIGELYLVASGVQSKNRRELLEQAADAIEELSKREADMSHNMAALSLKVLRAEEKTPRWIPVTERLPEPMKYVLLMVRRTFEKFNNRPFISTGYVATDKVSWWCSHDGDCSNNGVEVTHWMPLPELPKEK